MRTTTTLAAAATLLLLLAAGAQSQTGAFKVDSLSVNANPFVVTRGQTTQPFKVRSEDPTTTTCHLTVQYGPTGGVSVSLDSTTKDGDGNFVFTWPVNDKATAGDGKGMGGYCTRRGGAKAPMNGTSQASHPIKVL